MNVKTDFLKPNERIIYLILIIALVIALITISTCNKRTLDENYFVKSQVEALTGDMKDLEAKVVDEDSTIREKTQQLIQQKNEIQKLITQGQITAADAQKRIKELRAQLADVREEVILQKQIGNNNSDSLGRVISRLRSENSGLESQVNSLRDELSKKTVTQNVEVKAPEEIQSIAIMPETKLSPKGIFLSCKLYQDATKYESFQVFIYDEKDNLVSPQNGIYSFQISKGERSFSGSSSTYQRGAFKVGKKYSIVIRNSSNKEIARSPFRVPFL